MVPFDGAFTLWVSLSVFHTGDVHIFSAVTVFLTLFLQRFSIKVKVKSSKQVEVI